MPEKLLRATTSLCGRCKRSLPAEIWRVDGTVVMRKHCPDHGAAEAVVSPNADWYDAVMAQAPRLERPTPRNPVAQGCPFDCGPCTAHEQQVQLPIVPITSACNLDCPICYTHNRNEGAYHMSEPELRAILGHLRAADPAARIVNLTGGEPTLHPSFERLVELCQEAGVRRITVSTHGLRFLKDEWLLESLARIDARVILSFDSFQGDVNRDMLGGQLLDAKMKVLALLEKHRVNTTLLPVVARGYNDGEIGAFVRLALSKDFIRSVELHTMTFTGHGGAAFDRAGRLTGYDVLAAIEAQTNGTLRIADFVPSPSAHPLCYQVTYLLRLDDGRWLPFPRFMSPGDLRSMLGGMLYLVPGPEMETHLHDLVNRLFAGDIEVPPQESDAVLRTLRRLTDEVFAPGLSEVERLRRAEASTKAVYVHAHMDEETFDTDRIRQCCVGIREPSGQNIPSCSYNVLYRDKDARFTTAPAEPLVKLGLGRLS
jgi:uncharacterized radical SAM superfamily Fe-S cluster-containing enzyme